MGERTGQRLGAYEVADQIAIGATGGVYEARHLQSGERVAIKVLHPGISRDPVAVERFLREYETAKALDHPHVVKATHFGNAPDGSPFMIMELLEGEELSAIIRREGPLRPARIVRIVCQLALALQHAHAHGVIHRDLKPDNVFVCDGPAGDEIRILDFGSVKLQVPSGPKLTALGTTLGSPYYMSPEQATGKLDVDGRTDVFALSALTYELSTGRVAFDGESVAEILMKIVGEDPPAVSSSNAAYPWAFDDVVKKGLSKDKSKRFASAVELAEALLRSLDLEADVTRFAHAPTEELERRFDAAPDIRELVSMRPLAYPTSIPAPLPERDKRGPAILVAAVLAIVLLSAASLAWL